MKNKYSHLDKKMKDLYINKKMSSPQIAKELRIKSHSIVQRHIKKMGIKLRDISESKKGIKISGITKERMKEAQTGNKNHFYGKKHSRTTRDKISKTRIDKKVARKENNPNWNGGEKVIECVYCNNKLNTRRGDTKKRFCSLECYNKYQRENPEEFYTWKGGKSFEPYDINFNRNFKRMIRKRDNQICLLCRVHREKLKRALHVHHINYKKTLTLPENCISLCNSCHGKVGENRKHWIKFFRSLLSERYEYNYSKELEPILII